MLRKFAVMNSPQEWYFKNPEDNFIIRGSNLADTANKVRMYRAQNEHEPLDYLESIIENYLCFRPENRGSCEKMPPLKRGLYTTIKAGVLLIKQMMYNSFASQEVADRRASLCVECPLNVFPDKSAFVTWADHIAEQTVGERKSKFHNEIGNCEACTCLLRSKVFYNDKIKLKPKVEIKMREINPNCWQLPENQ